MRDSLIAIILTAAVLSCLPQVVGSAAAQSAAAFTEAGTDATQVTAFLKCLKASVSLGNRLKVASLVEFPLKAWIGGEETVIETESEFHARYGKIFDADMKKAIADATVDSVSANAQGLTFDNGRVWFRPVGQRKNALKIVAIGQPVQPR